MARNPLLAPEPDWWETRPNLLSSPDGRGPLAPDPRADALGQVYQQIMDNIAKQQQISRDRGLWEGGQFWEGGHPTRGGLLDAANQVGTAVALGTTSAGGRGMKPEVMYHGTKENYSGPLKPNLTLDDHVPGISLTSHPEEAGAYGPTVKQVEVSLNKPMLYSQLEKYAARKAGRAGDDNFSAMEIDPHQLLKWLKQDGYDAIDYRSDPMLGYGLRVFDPSSLRVIE